MPRSLSVVIASAAEGDFLFSCLDALLPEARAKGIEVIVVDRRGGATVERLKRDYAEVRLFETPPAERLSVPALRHRGAREAKGEVVCVVEEHCHPAPDWLATIEASFEEGDAAIGGPVHPQRFEAVRDWAIYFSEFHNYLPPWEPGPREALNGVNIAYDREKLLAVGEALDGGYWEVVAHPLLLRSGAFRSVPGMIVRHAGPFDFGFYLSQRSLLSRVWGAGQRERVPFAKRAFYLIAAPLFPFLLLLRIVGRVRASGAWTGELVKAMPQLFLIALAYVWGEWCGYLLGYGDSLERIE